MRENPIHSISGDEARIVDAVGQPAAAFGVHGRAGPMVALTVVLADDPGDALAGVLRRRLLGARAYAGPQRSDGGGPGRFEERLAGQAVGPTPVSRGERSHMVPHGRI